MAFNQDTANLVKQLSATMEQAQRDIANQDKLFQSQTPADVDIILHDLDPVDPTKNKTYKAPNYAKVVSGYTTATTAIANKASQYPLPGSSGAATRYIKLGELGWANQGEIQMQFILSLTNDYGTNSSGMHMDFVSMSTRTDSATNKKSVVSESTSRSSTYDSATQYPVSLLINQYTLGGDTNLNEYRIGVVETKDATTKETTKYTFWLEMNAYASNVHITYLQSKFAPGWNSSYTTANSTTTLPAGIIFATRKNILTESMPNGDSIRYSSIDMQQFDPVVGKKYIVNYKDIKNRPGDLSLPTGSDTTSVMFDCLGSIDGRVYHFNVTPSTTDNSKLFIYYLRIDTAGGKGKYTFYIRQIYTDANTAQLKTDIGLKSAAFRDIGTSGNLIAAIDGLNTWGKKNTFNDQVQIKKAATFDDFANFNGSSRFYSGIELYHTASPYIDFHHPSDTNNSDYTARIIENPMGQLNIEGSLSVNSPNINARITANAPDGTKTLAIDHTSGYHWFYRIHNANGGLDQGDHICDFYSILRGDPPSQHPVCTINAIGNIMNINTSYGGYSDRKLKTNIAPAKSQLEDIRNIEVVNFEFKADPGKKQIGVIAQQVQEVSPGLVGIDKKPETGEETLTVAYSVINIKLLKAFQEMCDKVDILENRIKELEGGK